MNNASKIKRLNCFIVFITYQMYEEQLAIVFKGNAKEGIEGKSSKKLVAGSVASSSLPFKIAT